MSSLWLLCRSVRFLLLRSRTKLLDHMILLPRRNFTSPSKPQILVEDFSLHEQSTSSIPLSQNISRLAFLMYIREHYGHERLYGRTVPITKLVLKDRWLELSEEAKTPYYQKAEQLASDNKLEPSSYVAPVSSERAFLRLKLDRWNPYVIFVRDYQEKIFKDAEADVPLVELCELLSDEWENMSAAEQEKYFLKSKLEDPVKFYDFPEAQVNEGIMDKRAADVMENWPKAALKRTETIDEMEARGDGPPTSVSYKDGFGKFRQAIRLQEAVFVAHAERVAMDRWKKLSPKEQEEYNVNAANDYLDYRKRLVIWTRNLLEKGLGHEIDIYYKKNFGVTEKEQAFFDWFPFPRRPLGAGRRYRDDLLLKNAWKSGETWEDFQRRAEAQFEELPMAEKLPYKEVSKEEWLDYHNKLDRWSKVVAVIAGYTMPKRPASAFDLYLKFREFLEDESDREKLKRVARKLSLLEAAEDDWLKMTDWERDEFIVRFKRVQEHHYYVAWPIFMSKVTTNFEKLNDALFEKLVKYFTDGGKMDEELERLYEKARQNWQRI